MGCKQSFLFGLLVLALSTGCGAVGPSAESNTNEGSDGNPPSNYQLADTVTWISSARLPGGSLNIAMTTSDGQTSETTYLTDSPYNDYKPVISPDGTKIAFFRAYSEGDDFYLWDTT